METKPKTTSAWDHFTILLNEVREGSQDISELGGGRKGKRGTEVNGDQPKLKRKITQVQGQPRCRSRGPLKKYIIFS